MAVIDYVGNINHEVSQLEHLQTFVDTKLANVNDTLVALESVWQDENSASFLSTQKTVMDELKAANNKSKQSANEYLQEIENILKIYVG